MGHPHSLPRGRADKEGALSHDLELGGAVLTLTRRFNFATEQECHRLLSVANSEHGHAKGEDVPIRPDHMVKFLRNDGRIGIVSPAAESDPKPKHLGDCWHWINSIAWWKNHWERNPNVQVQNADFMPNGWQLWVQWEEFLVLYGKRKDPDIGFLLKCEPDNRLGFIRMVAGKTAAG